MSAGPVMAFFGDRERPFLITAKLIEELERITGAGVGALCKRLFKQEFSYADLRETIRLGLIGGGASTFEAASLVQAYCDGRPLAETFPIALSILEAVWFGKSPTPAPDSDPDREMPASAPMMEDVPAAIEASVSGLHVWDIADISSEMPAEPARG